MTSAERLTVAIDTTSDVAGVALMEGKALLGEVTWRSRQAHSRELLPTLDWLLQRGQRSRSDLGAIAVCLGPGSYAGMRVGVSTAKALAYGLDISLVGVGRLAADAFSFAAVTTGRVVAVHAAGRAELAWATYEGFDGDLREVVAPRLGDATRLLEAVSPADLVCGELDKLDESLKRELAAQDIRLHEASAGRVLAVARLGINRLGRGEVDSADTLVPLYLRAPAIGPQPPR